MLNNKTIKIIIEILIVIGAAFISAVGLHVFVYPFNFAPSGIDGIATMLQSLTGLSAGIYSIVLNIPLLICAYFILNKKYVWYTVLFTLVSSAFLILFKYVNFYQFNIVDESMIASVFSGILLGLRTGIMIWLSASSGGIDIVASVFQKKRPYLHIENIITLICVIIMLCSYFVYKSLLCLLLSLIQMVVFNATISFIMKGTRYAIKVTIITKNIDAIKNDIIVNLKHGGTIVNSRGLYGNEQSSQTIHSIINYRQLPKFLEMMKKYPDAFVYYSEVKGVHGNFRWKYNDEVK